MENLKCEKEIAEARKACLAIKDGNDIHAIMHAGPLLTKALCLLSMEFIRPAEGDTVSALQIGLVISSLRAAADTVEERTFKDGK